MQQLGSRNTYTPSGASQACRSVAMSLNKEDTLSEHSLKTFPNNLDVNLRQSQTGGLKVNVFVLNKKGIPLMPCSPAKARHLLKQNKAKVTSRKPFTIQLNWGCEANIQETTLGIDAGSRTIGFSVVSKTKELISGEFELNRFVSKRISDRSMYRRTRRSRLWHRKPRFLNRTKSKKKGWLAPSVKHKIDSHIRLINKLKSLMPFSITVVEIAQFDAQKLQNVDIKSVEYQEGQMKGYDNLRAFILHRDKHTCQICKKREGIMNIHHITQRKDGGSDRPDNLVCVHKSCHKKFHTGKLKHVFKKPSSFRDTVIMNNIWKRITKGSSYDQTFGYITKRKRLEWGLDKTHYNDAFVIAGGKDQERTLVYSPKQSRRNNRCLQLNRKGFKPSIRKVRYNIQPNDLIDFEKKSYQTKGCHDKGSRIIIPFNNKTKSISIKKARLIRHGQGIVFDTRQFLSSLKVGVSLSQTI